MESLHDDLFLYKINLQSGKYQYLLLGNKMLLDELTSHKIFFDFHKAKNPIENGEKR